MRSSPSFAEERRGRAPSSGPPPPAAEAAAAAADADAVVSPEAGCDDASKALAPTAAAPAPVKADLHREPTASARVVDLQVDPRSSAEGAVEGVVVGGHDADVDRAEPPAGERAPAVRRNLFFRVHRKKSCGVDEWSGAELGGDRNSKQNRDAGFTDFYDKADGGNVNVEGSGQSCSFSLRLGRLSLK